MPSRPTSHPADIDPKGLDSRDLDLGEAVARQRQRIDVLERRLWRGGRVESVLAEFQGAYRELEALIANGGADARHSFVIVIPVADSPQHLQACLDSLLTLCERYGYGGQKAGVWRKVSVLLADDSADVTVIEQNRQIAARCSRRGVAVEYFGSHAQLALLERLPDVDLDSIIGVHADTAFAHKGQAMMRNVAYLRLAEIARQRNDERLLFYTIDSDQHFKVAVPAQSGQQSYFAINYFDELDRLFTQTAAVVLTGKVVGDPPVSPAVMMANFLDDVIAFVDSIAQTDPAAVYAQPAAERRGSGEAAYHDMAALFGFAEQQVYRYHCTLPGQPGNGACFSEFAAHLNSFFHGEHPTRTTWYDYQSVEDSVQPARTVYTGNYVFTAQALSWFIPFAPLRLRMSGPTMGRLLKATLAERFVSANVPMLHTRTLAATGASEFRPGVLDAEHRLDLSDEFERQFFGDVMLFSIERLCDQGYPEQGLNKGQVDAVLEEVRSEMLSRYHDKQRVILERLVTLSELLRDIPVRWRDAAYAPAMAAFDAFVDNVRRNFGEHSPGYRRIGDAANAQRWLARQAVAICGLHDDRVSWQQSLEKLRLGIESG